MAFKLSAPIEVGQIETGAIELLGSIHPEVSWPFNGKIDSTAEDILTPVIFAIREHDPLVYGMKFYVSTGAVSPGNSQHRNDWHFDAYAIAASDALTTEYVLGPLSISRIGCAISESFGDGYYSTVRARRQLDGLSTEEMAAKGIKVKRVRPNTLNVIGSRCLHRSAVNTTDSTVKRSSLIGNLYRT